MSGHRKLHDVRFGKAKKPAFVIAADALTKALGSAYRLKRIVVPGALAPGFMVVRREVGEHGVVVEPIVAAGGSPREAVEKAIELWGKR